MLHASLNSTNSHVSPDLKDLLRDLDFQLLEIRILDITRLTDYALDPDALLVQPLFIVKDLASEESVVVTLFDNSPVLALAVPSESLLDDVVGGFDAGVLADFLFESLLFCFTIVAESGQGHRFLDIIHVNTIIGGE